jgi:threonine dehydrogenase-like Zn-dependent dehydrogenase
MFFVLVIIQTFLETPEDGNKFDVVVEATGSPRGIKEALNRVKPKGKIIVKSTFHGISDLNLSSLVVDEIELIGSRCGPFEKALKLLQKEDWRLEEMVDADFPLEKALEAFDKARDPEVLKVLITP